VFERELATTRLEITDPIGLRWPKLCLHQDS